MAKRNVNVRVDVRLITATAKILKAKLELFREKRKTAKLRRENADLREELKKTHAELAGLAQFVQAVGRGKSRSASAPHNAPELVDPEKEKAARAMQVHLGLVEPNYVDCAGAVMEVDNG